MVWHRTKDGSIEDHAGKVLFFTKERFVTDICLGRCCFICGAEPGSKPFNDEHVIPEWVLRKFGLFDRAIGLPNGTTVKYGQYKVPCCAECNALMGREIEERISRVVNAEPEAVQKHIAAGNGLEFFVWLGLIFLKTHLKDRDFRIDRDLREPDDKIGDLYDWQGCITYTAWSDVLSMALTLKRRCLGLSPHLRPKGRAGLMISTTAMYFPPRPCC